MIFLLILAICLGILIGIFTGLMPGIHTNLVSSLIVVLIPIFLEIFSPIQLVIFIVSLSITNLFLEIIPSTYLGAPDEDTSLATLPGHELLLDGKGHRAILITLLGNLSGIIILILIIPLMFLFLDKVYPFFEKMMAWLLVWICIFIIVDNKEKTLAGIIFILSGILGFTALNLNITQPLLPLLTGLFGTSGILYSMNENTKIPPQETKIAKIIKKDFISPSIASFLISPLCSFLPGLGSSQATIIGSKITGKLNREQFLFLNGSINTLLMTLSFLTLYLINKSRTGSASAISEITRLMPSDLMAILGVIILVSVCSFFIAILISKKIAHKINELNYLKISKIILGFLIILTIGISGFTGLIVLIASTFLGLTCQYYDLRKGILMGCLLIPTIIIYLPF